MPLYTFRCRGGHTKERLRAMGRRDEPMRCECGATATRIIDAVNLYGRERYQARIAFERDYRRFAKHMLAEPGTREK